MKVLQINSVCGVGSTGRIVTDIHNLLLEQGHDSIIAYGRGLPKNSNGAIRIGTNLDNYSHLALTRIFDKHGFGSNKATREFINKIEDINPDIIHLHNIHGYYLNVELLFNYLKKVEKPVVWTLHDCWAFTGHCAYFDYIGCEKWQTLCSNCPEKSTYPGSLLIDNSKNNFMRKNDIFTGVKDLTIVTPSRWLANLVKKSYLNEYPVKVINNGIDLRIFKPTESNFRERYGLENKFVILGVANIWDRRKGLKYFIDLSERINTNEIIVLVGLTEKQKSLLPKNIVGITKTNNVNELVEIYSTANIFINPTLEDNFPTTNLEALACGTPVVTFETGGSIESVDDSCGFVVKKGDIDDVLSSIRKLSIGNRILDYSKNSILRAEKLYYDKDRYNEYIDIYNKLYY
ncbi:glycosyltransferase [Ureibacillus manganicus]|uniref:Glycosyl transferase n=1 Tax=Ureibacillus manganicus DSM 26584 TaxID=1384049 RepID=A0A0A3INJ7_9BACL|nr:glycosyltransferase [Ureibacillus manganicus]KGR76412.1 glycosyl transferase [Ureibacillus manganicus DSM 26584]